MKPVVVAQILQKILVPLTLVSSPDERQKIKF